MNPNAKLFLGKIANIALKLDKFADLDSPFFEIADLAILPNFYSTSMKNAPNPIKTPSIESIMLKGN